MKKVGTYRRQGGGGGGQEKPACASVLKVKVLTRLEAYHPSGWVLSARVARKVGEVSSHFEDSLLCGAR